MPSKRPRKELLKDLINAKKRLYSSSSLASWMGFSLAYLDLANQGCKKMLLSKDSDKFLTIPVVYNIKHALEGIVKFFTKLLKNDYDQGHDLRKLFRGFKSLCKDKMSAEDKTELEKIISELEYITYKYFNLHIIERYLNPINILSIEDYENTFLRYPEKSKIFLHIDFDDIAKKISEEDVKEIQEDILNTHNLIQDLFSLLKKYQSIESSV